MKHFKILMACLIVLAVFMVGVTPVGAQFYKGKTITILVGYAAGGGSDTTARLLARHFPKYIPGNPKVVVKNMTGGGGMKVRNYMYERAKPDGLTLCFMPSAVQAQLLGEPGVRFDYGKFSIIGPLLGPPIVAYARTDIVPGGLKRSADIIKAKDLKFAGHRPSSWLDLLVLPALDLLGLKYTYIPGYRGTAKVSAALQRGEANISATSLAGYRSTVEPVLSKGNQGGAIWYYPIKDAQGNFIKNPNAGDIPTFIDVYKEIKGTPSGWEWEAFSSWFDDPWTALKVLYGPPNVNPDLIKELRVAFKAMMATKEMKADEKKIFGFTHEALSAAQIEKAMGNLNKKDPKIIQYWRDYVAEKGK